jgi:hypothetical protein
MSNILRESQGIRRMLERYGFDLELVDACMHPAHPHSDIHVRDLLTGDDKHPEFSFAMQAAHYLANCLTQHRERLDFSSMKFSHNGLLEMAWKSNVPVVCVPRLMKEPMDCKAILFPHPYFPVVTCFPEASEADVAAALTLLDEAQEPMVIAEEKPFGARGSDIVNRIDLLIFEIFKIQREREDEMMEREENYFPSFTLDGQAVKFLSAVHASECLDGMPKGSYHEDSPEEETGMVP